MTLIEVGNTRLALVISEPALKFSERSAGRNSNLFQGCCAIARQPHHSRHAHDKSLASSTCSPRLFLIGFLDTTLRTTPLPFMLRNMVALVASISATAVFSQTQPFSIPQELNSSCHSKRSLASTSYILEQPSSTFCPTKQHHDYNHNRQKTDPGLSTPHVPKQTCQVLVLVVPPPHSILTFRDYPPSPAALPVFRYQPESHSVQPAIFQDCRCGSLQL